jgi:dynein heavy chain
LKDKVAEFKAKLPVLLELGNPNMKPRHWERIFKAIKQPYFEGLEFTLSGMLENGILAHSELVSEVSGTSSGEAQLEGSLKAVADGWETINFPTINYRDAPGIYVLGGLEEIFTLLEDNQVTLQTMSGSRFITGVKQDVDIWEKKLSLFSETLDEWVQCQKTWMYLETIFGAPDIQKQLPAETQKFLTVDKVRIALFSLDQNCFTNSSDLRVNVIRIGKRLCFPSLKIRRLSHLLITGPCC